MEDENVEFNNLNNEEKGLILRRNYKEWKLSSLDEAGYFIIFQGFSENGILRDISGNALKLYIYLGINSNNFEGVVWHSNSRIAKYFNKAERTVRTWMKELEDLNLIKRMRVKYDGEVYTYLKPYNITRLDKTIKNLLDGTIQIIKNDELILNIENKIRPISSGICLYIYDEFNNRWIKGKLIINRIFEYEDDDEMISYVFKPQNKYMDNYIDIKKGKIYKVKIEELINL
jgi:DNA-binding Lrp family transcriptional regulator